MTNDLKYYKLLKKILSSKAILKTENKTFIKKKQYFTIKIKNFLKFLFLILLFNFLCCSKKKFSEIYLQR